MKNTTAMGNRPRISAPKPIWTFDDMPSLMVGDLLAFKADPGWQEWAVGLQGAKTFHWAIAGIGLPPDDLCGYDREIIGSINKGVAQELLSAYRHRHMRVYRPNLPMGVQDSLRNAILKRAAYYGSYGYDWLGVSEAAVSFILREIGIRLHCPTNHRFYCIEFVCQLWADFNFPLYDMDHPVTPVDLETSPQLKLIWGTF